MSEFEELLMMDDFDKVEVNSMRGGSHRKEERRIYFSKSGHTFTLTRGLCESCSLNEGDRLDLYRSKNGKMFMLKKTKAGCLTLRRPAHASRSLVIRSSDLWLNTVAFIGEDNLDKLNYLCEEGIVAFGLTN